ncbi:MAG: dihydrolipoyl dehydrogenase [Candidatus Omnitrophica bacterium]|nr:dihydrolipoyl dehydrogenase [Candidatus Omnitrophota bacterium]MDD5653022.1 dihydrolipoyl dehydrogenase [Candidatus Omnitrophota bacterium]
MDYDLIIIGAGWAGFNAALEAKKAGLKTALVEKGEVGGTCLNRGCIPTKSLINSAKVFQLSRCTGLNLYKLQERKEQIITQLRQGITFSLKGIDLLSGEAEILSSTQVKISEKTLTTKSLLIATGSKPVQIKGLEFDGKKIISSDEILNLKDEIPRSLLIVGGGVIGCEFASLFNHLGTAVTIAEKMPQLLPNEEREIAKKLENIFKKKGIKVNTAIDATTINLKDFSLVLVCVGRVPVVPNLEKAGVILERNRIVVDEYLRTNIPNIYAAGDCTGKIMLAHYAAYQGKIAAHNIAQPNALQKADNPNVPNCIFTSPEIASVGLNEEAAKAKGIEVKVNRFDFLASGMARILEETDGFIKIISDSKTDKILGASIIGPRATELIATLTLAVSCQLTLVQIRETIFAHPTISEAIHEAIS